MDSTTEKEIQIKVVMPTGYAESDSAFQNGERIVLSSTHKILILAELSRSLELDEVQAVNVFEMIYGLAATILENLPKYPEGGQQ